MIFPQMEESALCSLLIVKVKEYFQDEEHQKDFECWYKEKYGKEFEGRKYHEGNKDD